MKLPQVQMMIQYSENREKSRLLSSKNLLKYQLIIFISACWKTDGLGSNPCGSTEGDGVDNIHAQKIG
jgi:hypothetical protein